MSTTIISILGAVIFLSLVIWLAKIAKKIAVTVAALGLLLIVLKIQFPDQFSKLASVKDTVTSSDSVSSARYVAEVSPYLVNIKNDCTKLSTSADQLDYNAKKDLINDIALNGSKIADVAVDSEVAKSLKETMTTAINTYSASMQENLDSGNTAELMSNAESLQFSVEQENNQ